MFFGRIFVASCVVLAAGCASSGKVAAPPAQSAAEPPAATAALAMARAPSGTVAAVPTAASAEAAAAKPTPAPACATAAADADARFDRMYRTACHNCYEAQYAPKFAAVLDSTKTLEIDFWDDERPGKGARPGAWYVRHHEEAGNDSNCSPPGDLAACLRDVRDWSEAHPNHEVITVFLDKKQEWAKGRGPKEFDALIERSLPRAKLFTAADLARGHSSARAAARAGAWPTMESLRGRIVLGMTGGGLPNRNASQSAYVKARGSKALVFPVADADEEEDITGALDGFEPATQESVVFYNLKVNYAALGPTVRRAGFVSRVWGVPENDPSFREAVGRCNGFVALYKFSETAFNGGVMQGLLLPSEPAGGGM